MSDFNLDNIKGTWQNQKITPKYNSEEIQSMLNKKSRNYVKYIYWISLLEFLLFFGLTVFYVFNGNDSESFYHLIEKLGIEKTIDAQTSYEHLYFALKLLSILIGAYFVIRFYLLMKKVNIEENLKKFISTIISFRRAVRYFIIINVLLVLVYLGISGFVINQLINKQHIILSNSERMGFIMGICIATLISFGIIWVYYKVTYGILMKRLNATLNQLKEMEQENENN